MSSLNHRCTSLSLWTPGITDVSHHTQPMNTHEIVYFRDVGCNGGTTQIYMHIETYGAEHRKGHFFAVGYIVKIRVGRQRRNAQAFEKSGQ